MQASLYALSLRSSQTVEDTDTREMHLQWVTRKGHTESPSALSQKEATDMS